jgi:hypothetical protein
LSTWNDTLKKGKKGKKRENGRRSLMPECNGNLVVLGGTEPHAVKDYSDGFIIVFGSFLCFQYF